MSYTEIAGAIILAAGVVTYIYGKAANDADGSNTEAIRFIALLLCGLIALIGMIADKLIK